MLTPAEALLVADLFYTLDKKVRDDLHRRRIADERDCVSRLVDSFSYPFGIFNTCGFHHLRLRSQWFARVNSSQHEQTFGCDSMLVFRVGNQLKVGLFEAKWPRVLYDPTYRWDYAQKSTKRSHFTSQIKRQAAWVPQAAIWEMFFFEAGVGAAHLPFDSEGATCVRHQVAKALVDSKPSLDLVWNNADLLALLTQAQYQGPAPNLRQLVLDMLSCQLGQAITLAPGSRNFKLTATGEDIQVRQVTCPLLTFTDEEDSQPFIDEFMDRHGLTFFQQVDVERTRKQ